MTDLRTILEAERRGIELPQDVQATIDEARKRGLVPPRGTPSAIPQMEILTSPLPIPESTIFRGYGGAERMVKPSERLTTAANAGVMYNHGAPTGRSGLSFAYDSKDADSMAFLKKELSDHYGKDIAVRVGPATNDLEYYNPDEKRWSYVNAEGLDLGDVGSAIGPATTIVPEIMLSIGGAATMGPAGAVVGGGFGAFAGEIARLEYGRQVLGLNKNMTNEQLFTSAALAGGISLTGGALALAGAPILKSIQNAIRGLVFNAADEARFATNMEEARSIESEMANRGLDLNLNLAQQTGDPTLLAAQRAYYMTPGSKQSILVQQRKEQQDVMSRYLGQMEEPYLTGPATRQEAADAIQNEIRFPLDVERRLSAARVKKAEIQRDLTRLGIPVGENTRTVGYHVQSALNAERESFNQWAASERRLVHAAAGNTPIINKNFSTIASQFDRETRSAILPSLQIHKRGLVGPVEEGGNVTKIFDPNTEWTFDQAWDAVSELKRLARKAERDPTTLGPDASTYVRAYKALEKDIAESLAGTPGAAAYDAYRAAYRIQKTRLNEAIEKSVTDDPSNVFNNIFNNKHDELNDEVFSLLQQHPEARLKFRNAIFAHYRKAVIRDGVIDPRKHADWIAEYGDLARPHFSTNDFKLLGDAATSEKAFVKAQADDVARQKKLLDSFAGKITSLEPKQLYNELWDPHNIDTLRRFVKEAPKKAVDGLRSIVQKEIRMAMSQWDSATKQNALSFKSVNKYLEGANNHSQAIRTLFGDQYMNDLDFMRKALLTIQQEPVGGAATSITAFAGGEAAAHVENLFMKAMRMAYGPLAHAPYAVAQALKLRRGQMNEMVWEAIQNPDKLHDFVQLRSLLPGTKKAVAILGDLGALSLWEGSGE